MYIMFYHECYVCIQLQYKSRTEDHLNCFYNTCDTKYVQFPPHTNQFSYNSIEL